MAPTSALQTLGATGAFPSILHGSGDIRFFLMESLILAQDERLRRA